MAGMFVMLVGWMEMKGGIESVSVNVSWEKNDKNIQFMVAKFKHNEFQE